MSHQLGYLWWDVFPFFVQYFIRIGIPIFGVGSEILLPKLYNGFNSVSFGNIDNLETPYEFLGS